MASKQVDIPDIGTVHLYKRAGVRTLKLSITSRGQIRVTMPPWLPYEAGLTFARSRKAWIQDNSQHHGRVLVSGQIIGKSHRLLFEKSPTATAVKTKVTASVIYITYPAAQDSADPTVQGAAERASIKALRAQAEAVLPDRLAELASIHGFEYRSVQVKRLTGRWGSCDGHQNIVLNLFLMQLPWDLIDYVLLHELTHTSIMRHGPSFWEAMQRVLPDTQRRRKAMKTYQPTIGFIGGLPAGMA